MADDTVTANPAPAQVVANAQAATQAHAAVGSNNVTLPIQVVDMLVDLAKKQGPKVVPQFTAEAVAAAAAASDEVKPGYKTTEFWICAAVSIGGVVLNLLPDSSLAGHIVGGLMAIAASFGYTASRIKIKNG